MAWVSVKRSIDDIHRRIDRISKVGYDNFQKYYDFIDSVINRGQWALFTQVLYLKYNYSFNEISVSEMKEQSWKIILSHTNTTLQESLSRLLEQKNVYRLGLNIYPNNTLQENEITHIGEINEVDYYIEYPLPDFTESEYQKRRPVESGGNLVTGNKLTKLIVTKDTETIEFISWDHEKSYDANIVILYGLAIDYLLIN